MVETGAMRVWSGIFSRLPSAPLEVGDAGLEWQWVAQSNSTDADCPDARRFAFVAGYAPPYQPCPTYDPNQTFVDENGNLVDATGAPVQQERRGWREFFGFGRDEEAAPPADTAPPAPAPAPAPAPPVEESP